MARFPRGLPVLLFLECLALGARREKEQEEEREWAGLEEELAHGKENRSPRRAWADMAWADVALPPRTPEEQVKNSRDLLGPPCDPHSTRLADFAFLRTQFPIWIGSGTQRSSIGMLC